jgi:hypothetical protein
MEELPSQTKMSYIQVMESTKRLLEDTASPFHALIASTIGKMHFMDNAITNHTALVKEICARIDITKLDAHDEANLDNIMTALEDEMKSHAISWGKSVQGLQFAKAGLEDEFKSPRFIKIENVSSADVDALKQHQVVSDSSRDLLDSLLHRERSMVHTMGIAFTAVFVTRMIESKQ